MIFGSVGSVLRSVRSIWRPRVVVDRPDDDDDDNDDDDDDDDAFEGGFQ